MKKFLLTLLAVGLLASTLFISCSPKEVQKEVQAEPVVQIDTLEIAVNGYFENKPDHNYMIAQKDIVDMVIAGEDMVLLDIRKPEDYAKGHLKGAVNLPWGIELYNQLRYIPRDKDVYINCYSGQTAGQAVVLLNVAGISARSIKYGWNFGISKVEGVEAVIETEATVLDTSKSWETDAAIDAAYKAYYTEFASLSGTPFGSNIVSEENAKKILDSGDSDVVFVSIRKPEHYAAGHIDTAINIPWAKGMNDMFASLPADKKIIVNCYSGQTAGQAVAGLKLLGYDAVSLKGGMGTAGNAPLGWANKEYPVVTSN
ncbi:MAG: rhodanese-like domain-containing protein [Spirochaetota bacterium]|nr:rhodanese-like domain-containing protein [Spirochaetota bacterium]